jgi:hypothetical protein
LRNWGKLTYVYWDDFELWKDSTVTTETNEQTLDKSATIYPNPFFTETTIRTNKIFKNASLTVFNLYGQTVKQIKNIYGPTIVLQRDNLPAGLYFVSVTEGHEIITVDKLIITDRQQ